MTAREDSAQIDALRERIERGEHNTVQRVKGLVELLDRLESRVVDLEGSVAALEDATPRAAVEQRGGSGWGWAFAILATGAAGVAVYECNQRKQRAQQRLLRAPTADYEITR